MHEEMIQRVHCILVVEDDMLIYELYCSLFASMGYEVISAESRDTAKKIYKSSDRIDLAVVDYQLPDGIGTDIIGDLRELNPSLPAILTSGQFRNGEEVPNLPPNTDFLPKPVPLNELESLVLEILAVNV